MRMKNHARCSNVSLSATIVLWCLLAFFMRGIQQQPVLVDAFSILSSSSSSSSSSSLPITAVVPTKLNINRATTAATAATTTTIFAAHKSANDNDIKDNNNNDDDYDNDIEESYTPPTRRDLFRTTASIAAATSTSFLLLNENEKNAAEAIDILPSFLQPKERQSNGGIYIPAKRSTAYLVDSTIPPTLVPFKAQREAAILKQLGSGVGTSKEPLIQNALTLNNIMQKTVFGSTELVSDIVLRGGKKKDARGGLGYASFVCMGVNYADAEDASLALALLTDIIKPRKNQDTALGFAFAPLSTQDALNKYIQDGNEDTLKEALVDKQVSADVVNMYLPLMKFARSKRLDLLALAPEVDDVRVVRSDGLQSLNIDRREQYVVDAKGFIGLTQDEKFKLYTDKSLLKDFVPPQQQQQEEGGSAEKQDGPGDFFAERILVHEACATSVAKYATKRPDSLVAVVAPIQDVRYMGGINGRIPRICRALNEESTVDDMSVTTILLNPSAEETLSGSRYLRLEIGTAPKNLAYQTKIADYIWFSKMPKVNMLSRMMNPI